MNNWSRWIALLMNLWLSGVCCRSLYLVSIHILSNSVSSQQTFLIIFLITRHYCVCIHVSFVDFHSRVSLVCAIEVERSTVLVIRTSYSYGRIWKWIIWYWSQSVTNPGLIKSAWAVANYWFSGRDLIFMCMHLIRWTG